ncbi:hypothetical protein [Candidatus Poriferisocius sp.]|uniref:hypothetical protein n=1 Tax=Candidatus Poriferisocius sp. TaxID=3101276 RepID=UPI003B011599
MARSRVDKRLAELADRLKRLRADMEVAEEQCLHFDALADDARLRSLVSETPASERHYKNAFRRAETMNTYRARLREEIHHLEQKQDELLDRFYSDG